MAIETSDVIAHRRGMESEDQRRTHELAVLYAVSATLHQALTEQEALSQALKQVLSVLSLEGGCIYVWDPAAEQLKLVVSEGKLASGPVETTIKPGECSCGLTIAGSLPFTTQEAGVDPLVSLDGCPQHGGHTCTTVPLLAKERALGVLHVTGRGEGLFSDGDMALLRSVGALMGIALENMRLREDARRAEALTTLIQEMHHRIKNNLQTVADLLSLEMSASPSSIARKSLHDSIGRIKSIAVVHELLSVEQLRLTNITELAHQVCDLSLRHLVRPDQHVDVVIDGPPIYLPSKQATALALVMNELIANALEHAFSLSGRRGRLEIQLASDGPQVTVTVGDNGRGLPPDFDLHRTRGLGLQIVRTLVEKDLNGTLRLESGREGGSQATLVFYK